MKKVATRILLAFFCFFSFAALKSDSGPQLTFKVSEYNFGKIQEGVIAEYSFVYTNTGDAPLEIREVRPSCGCTAPVWYREPLAPGASQSILIKYNSNGHTGPFYKTIAVTSNVSDDTQVIAIRGEVIKRLDGLGEDPNQSPVRVGN